MLYTFHGSDTTSGLKKARTLIDSLRAKKPDASYVSVEAGQWTPSVIEEHLGGQGLFSKAYIIFLDRVTENAEAKDAIADFAEPMNESANIFIVLEAKLNVGLKKAFEKHATKVVECEDQKMAENKAFKREEFNIFALADALGSRDRFKAWSIYRQAIDRGLEVESIAGTIFWQIKSMILARDAKSASESGLSPFVFMKAKKGAGNYSVEELNGNLARIISIYHDAHRGKVDGELALERFLLA